MKYFILTFCLLFAIFAAILTAQSTHTKETRELILHTQKLHQLQDTKDSLTNIFINRLERGLFECNQTNEFLLRNLEIQASLSKGFVCAFLVYAGITLYIWRKS